MKRAMSLAVAAVVAGMGISQAQGATAYFIGGSSDGNTGLGTTSWTDPLNWQDGYIPQTGDKVVFQSRSSGANTYNWVRVVLADPTTIESLDLLTDLGVQGTSSTPLTLTSGNLNRIPTNGSISLSAPIVIGSNGVWTHEGTQNQSSALNIQSVSGNASLELRGNANWAGGNNWAQYGLSSLADLTGGLTISRGAELVFSHADATTDRLANAMAVRLDNGRINFSGASNIASTETIGDLSLSGRNFITASRSGTGSAFIEAASLTRDDRATLWLRNADLGTQGGLRVTGGIPMTDGMIAPWLVTSTSTSGSAEVSYAKYDPTMGVVPLAFTARNQNNFTSAASDEIVYLARDTNLNPNHPELDGDLTVKALKVGGSMTVGGTGTLTISSGGLIARNGTQTINVPVAFGSEAVIYSTDSSGYTILNVNGPVSGSDGLTIHGGSQVNLGSGSNTFTGPVTINHGQLRINNGSTDGYGLNRAGGVVLPVHVGKAGSFYLNGRSQRIGGLDGYGTVGTNSSSTTLTIVRDDSQVSNFGGTTAGSILNVVKQGDGTQIFSGTLSHGGTTTIDAGVLQIDGTLAAGGAAVTVNPGGTLGGNGSIQRDVVSHGAIAPGASVGELTVDSLSLESGSVLDWEVGSDGVDLLTVNGLLDINGPVTLNISEAGTFSEGQYTLIEFGSLDGSIGDISFGSVPSGFAYDLQQGVSSIDLVVAIPEPAGLALLGLAVPALLRRRRI